MGRRRGVEDEFEDDHNLSDDDDPILGTLKPTAKEGQRLHTDNGKGELARNAAASRRLSV